MRDAWDNGFAFASRSGIFMARVSYSTLCCQALEMKLEQLWSVGQLPRRLALVPKTADLTRRASICVFWRMFVVCSRTLLASQTDSSQITGTLTFYGANGPGCVPRKRLITLSELRTSTGNLI